MAGGPRLFYPPHECVPRGPMGFSGPLRLTPHVTCQNTAVRVLKLAQARDTLPSRHGWPAAGLLPLVTPRMLVQPKMTCVHHTVGLLRLATVPQQPTLLVFLPVPLQQVGAPHPTHLC